MTQGTEEVPGRGDRPRRAGRGARPGPARAAVIAAAVAAAGALLFLGYLQVSWTVAATSDGAAEALQARDMLAGNWLLHGWTLSDVSFYATELPEYVLVELARPFGLGVIHVCAALTYTLLVLTVVALAVGRTAGREGFVGGTVAGAIMLAPQLGYGAFVLLLSPDHVGTEVPLLLGWLLLDLAPRRWWVPATLCVLLTVVQFSDRVALVTAVLPLILVCAVTLARRRRAGWFELALIAAAIASVGLSAAAARALEAAGGFTGHPLVFTLAPLSQLWTHARLTGWGILELYGANFLGVTGPAGLAFAALHLIGLTLATAAVAVALWHFIRPARGGASLSGLVDAILAVALVANLVSFALSIDPGVVFGSGYAAREMAAILPLGAALAGRVFGPALAGRVFRPVPVAAGRPASRARWRGQAGATVRSKSSLLIVFIVFIVLAGYAGALGYSAAQPSVPGQESALADWLLAHGLRYGLGQSSANVVTVETGARVEVEPITVSGGRVRALLYQSAAAAYDPRLHDAEFLVSRVPPPESWESVDTVPDAAVRATFGPPALTYRFDGFTVLVWNVNLLTRMAG